MLGMGMVGECLDGHHRLAESFYSIWPHLFSLRWVEGRVFSPKCPFDTRFSHLSREVIHQHFSPHMHPRTKLVPLSIGKTSAFH